MTDSIELSPRLCELLGDLLEVTVVDVKVARSLYTSSFPIDELTVTCADGNVIELVRKDLSWDALNERVRTVKPPFLHDPARELGMYRLLLAAAPQGPARWYGNVADADVARRWLLLERVDGVGLNETGDTECWVAAARWVARFHTVFADRVGTLRCCEVPLLVHDERWLHRWADRARSAPGDPRTQRALKHVCDHVDALNSRLARVPVTLVHGEFYASNVKVVGVTGSLRVCALDWEMAALAPALCDLAALTAGSLDPVMRTDIERAYCETASRPYDDNFAGELDVCRLAQCIQWLGWAPGWQPAAHHRHDWLNEAVELVERLRL